MACICKRVVLHYFRIGIFGRTQLLFVVKSTTGAHGITRYRAALSMWRVKGKPAIPKLHLTCQRSIRDCMCVCACVSVWEGACSENVVRIHSEFGDNVVGVWWRCADSFRMWQIINVNVVNIVWECGDNLVISWWDVGVNVVGMWWECGKNCLRIVW